MIVTHTKTKIVIIGAGFGGIAMAVALRQADIHDFILLEKGPDVGGVWRDNSYPGCSCDVPSHLYSFSFAPYRGTHTRYPAQREILSYLSQVAQDFALLPHLRLNTEVTRAAFQDDSSRWRVVTASGHLWDAECVIFAVGQLHRPKFADIPGREDFSGPILHPAVWDQDVDLCGKRIAIIGTGSSAAQMLPRLASVAESVTVYQRSAPWVLPKPEREFGRLARWLLGTIPGAHRMYRESLSYGADMLLSPIARSTGPLKLRRRAAEAVARWHLRRHTADNTTLRSQLTPTYPIGAKRIIFDGAFYAALSRPNVQLTTSPITKITPTGIQTVTGEHTPVDIIVSATGFKASEFLVPIAVTGRGARHLNAEWVDGAEAFMGLAVRRYPNAFLIAGPNAFNPAGSNPAMKEAQVEFIVRCLRWKDEVGASAVEVGEGVMAEYRAWLAKRMEGTVWMQSEGRGVESWYRHGSGKVTNPWPASARRFRRMLRGWSPEDCFEFGVSGRGAGFCEDGSGSSGQDVVRENQGRADPRRVSDSERLRTRTNP